jgi:hypothetical protein
MLPYSTSVEELDRKDITSNYIFAGDIVYKGERIGASSELCTYLIFNNHDHTIKVMKVERLFWSNRYLLFNE